MSEPRSEAVRAWVEASTVPGTPVRASDGQPSHEDILRARADELARMRWCAVYGAAVARMVGKDIAGRQDGRGPQPWEMRYIVADARTEADAAAEAWAMLDATGAAK